MLEDERQYWISRWPGGNKDVEPPPNLWRYMGYPEPKKSKMGQLWA